jgi:hypothetical protein
VFDECDGVTSDRGCLIKFEGIAPGDVGDGEVLGVDRGSGYGADGRRRGGRLRRGFGFGGGETAKSEKSNKDDDRRQGERRHPPGCAPAAFFGCGAIGCDHDE